MTIIEMTIQDIACTGCIGKIRRKLNKYNGIEKVSILQGSGKLLIKFNSERIQSEEIQRNLYKAALRTFD